MKTPHSIRLTSLLLYSVLVLLLTWPTITQFTTHLPGDGGDDPAIAWNLWWVKYSLLNEPQNPFQSNYMFYPLGINLGFYTLTLLNGLTSLPLLLNFGVVPASNLHMWFTLLVGAYGAYLLTLYILAELNLIQNNVANRPILYWAATLSGIVYAFGSSRLFYIALGQFNIASAHWIPFTVLFFLKMVKAPHQYRWTVFTALFLVMQAWAELTYASFLIVFMALYWGYWLIFDRQRRVLRWPFFRATSLLVILFVIGISPFLAAIIPDMQQEGDFFVVDGGFADSFSGDLFGFLVPTMHHPLFGDWVSQSGIRGYDLGQHIYVGYGVLILSGIALFYRRRKVTVWFWAFAALSFALLIAGPQILIKGWGSDIPGPFVILQKLPIFNGNRYPSRFSVMLLLALAPLVGIGFTTISQWVTNFRSPVRSILFWPICLLIVFENLSLPLPQSYMRIPEPYQIIANDNGDFTLLDIPFAWRNGFRVSGAWTTSFMFGQFYQTQHQKRLLQGNTSRNPTLKFQYFAEAPIIDSLTLLETDHPLPPDIWQKDKQYAAEVLQFFNIRYIVVRPEAPSYLNNPQATIPYIEQILPVEKRYQDEALTLYQVNLPPLPAQVSLIADSPLSNLYFAEGWGVRQAQGIVAHRQAARLLVPLNGQAQTIHLTVSQIDQFANDLWLSINGWQSAPVRLQQQRQQLAIDVPSEAVDIGLNEIFLHFKAVTTISPAQSDITIVSAGEEGGNLGQIYLNGVDISPGQRGYNIAIIDPENGLLKTASFDTHADPQASEHLTQFLQVVPDNAFIAVAAKDEASTLLSAEAVLALQSFGSRVDLRGQNRASHAFIGHQQGLIMEGMNPLQRPVKLTTGLGLIEPTAAAIFEAIEIQAK